MIVDGRRVDNGQDMKLAASLACETGLHLKILVIVHGDKQGETQRQSG